MSPFKIFILAIVILTVALACIPNCIAGDSAASATSEKGNYLVYIGTFTGGKSKGVYLCRMDCETGKLSPPEIAAETPNPSFLALDPHGHFLYAADEISNFQGKHAGAVAAYSIAPGSGKLTLLNESSTVGFGPCHIILDRNGKNALIANYAGGSLAILPIEQDGKLADASEFIQFEGKSINPERQEKPHTHCMALDAANRFAFACDLGLDKILIYRFDAAHGKLTPNDPPFAAIKPGSGPRHLTFHPNGHWAYLINEMGSTVIGFDYDLHDGTLKELQTVPLLPDDFKGKNTAAEIAVHPNGKFLYASNRGDDSIVVFAIDPRHGTLTFVQRQPTLGKTPRYFGIEPKGKFLIAANQDSDNLVVFAIDPASGKLTPTGETLQVPSPSCVKFLPGDGK